MSPRSSSTPASSSARLRSATESPSIHLEPRASSNLEENVAHPLAPYLYSVSTLHGLTISLAQDGADLGTVWGEQVAREMLRDAGFDQVTVEDVPSEPVNALFVARRR